MNSAITLESQPYRVRRFRPSISVKGRKETGVRFIILCGAHASLVLLCYRVPPLAAFHAFVVLGVGLWLALSGPRRLSQVSCWTAYMAGTEVMWRLSNAPVFWEFGKYATALVLLIAIIRSNLIRGRLLPIAYFGLLVPSVGLTLASADIANARALISGNMSGPFSLMVCALFFARQKLSKSDLKNIFIALIVPAIGIAAITIYSTSAAQNLVFTANSNKVTSGGFGPNQVSATLGLGVMAAWICLNLVKSRFLMKALLFGAMGLLAVQSALTFSRGGLYNAAISILLGSLFLLRDNQSRLKVMLILGVTIVTANFVVLPQLERFTNGTLSSRFSNTDTSGRKEIVMADLAIWMEHPLLGIGPGMAKGNRAAFYARAGDNGAHTEFSRLLSEHGSLGFCALVLFFFGGIQNVRRARSTKGKALIVALLSWSFLYMTNAAMRLVAPSFAYGLTFATFLLEENDLTTILKSNFYSRRRLLTDRNNRRMRRLHAEPDSPTHTLNVRPA